MREGYQVVAKSPGISSDLAHSLLEYMYPIGVKVEEFRESKSLLILDKNKIAYSIVKNIGVGYDGRRGTLYNHTFVISIEDFEKLNYDTRIFDEYFIKNSSIYGPLQTVKIDPIVKLPRLELLQKLDANVLKEILYSLFKRSKIALVNFEDIDLIPNLLAILPPPLRLVSFSTLVIEPDKQHKYEFIQIPEKIQNKVGKGFTIIQPQLIRPLSKHDDIFNESVQVLVDIVKTKDVIRLEKMFRDFQTISVQSVQKKNIKLREIFDQNEFTNIIKKENFEKLRQKIQQLYSSTEFNQASSRIVVSITKKLGRIIEQQLKRQQKSKTTNENDLNQLLSTAKILLDCMNYMLQYSEKTISISTKKEIMQEIGMLEHIIKKYGVSRDVTTYRFDPFQYMRMLYEQSVNLWLLPLWFLSKKKSSER